MSWKLNPAPAAAPEARARRLGILWQALVYLAILAGTLLCWTLEYDIPKLPAALLAALLGAALCVAAALVPRRALLPLMVTSFVVYDLIVLLNWIQVKAGAVFAAELIFSRFTQVFANYYYPVAPPVATDGLAAYTLFFVLASFLLSCLLGAAVLAGRSFLLTLPLTLPFFWFAYANKGLPPVVPTMLLFCGWGALLFKGNKNRQRPVQSAGLAAAGALTLAALLAALTAAFPLAGYRADERVLSTRARLEDTVEEIRQSIVENRLYESFAELGFGYGTGTVGSRSRPKVNLAKSGNLGFESGAAFSIRGFLPSNTYLRGFSCDVYTGSSWEQSAGSQYPLEDSPFQPLNYDPFLPYLPLVEESIQQAKDEMMHSSEGLSAAELDQVFFFHPGMQNNMIEIEYAETPLYIHSPYLMRDVTVYYEEEAAYYEDGFFETDASYERDALLRPDDEETAQFRLFYSYLRGEEVMSSVTYPDPGWAAMQIIGYGMSSSDYWVVDMEDALERVGGVPYDELSEEKQRYLDYITQAYTQLPKGLAPTLHSFAAAAGIRPAASQADWHKTAFEVGRLMRGFGRYTRSPGRMPVNADFVDFFLNDSQAGYCVHYASAGAAILRALGVPARYVEGYVVKEQLNSYETPDPEGQFIEVPMRNAHAWVEIWEPNYGWLPVEMTPGGADTHHAGVIETPGGQGASSQSQPQESSSLADSAASSSAAASSGAASDSGASSAAGGQGGGGSLAAILLFLGGLGLLGLLIATPHWVRKRRMHRFSLADANAAAQAMFHYLEWLQRLGGPAPSQAAYNLANKARFSPHTLAAEERHALLDEVQANRAQAWANLPLGKKLLMYILCL